MEQGEVVRSFEAVERCSKEMLVWQAVYQALQVAFQYVPFLISSVPAYCIQAFVDVVTRDVQYTKPNPMCRTHPCPFAIQ